MLPWTHILCDKAARRQLALTHIEHEAAHFGMETPEDKLRALMASNRSKSSEGALKVQTLEQ
jgi:hypothetical protein